MRRISVKDKRGLPELLKHLPMHDAVFTQIEYNKAEKKLWITTQNPYEKAETAMVFDGVQLLLSTDFHAQGDVWETLYGSDPTISCLIAKDSDPSIEPLLHSCGQSMDDLLYLLFESLSGGKMHILCETFSAEVRQTE